MRHLGTRSKEKQQGFILILVLIFIQLFSLLNLYALKSIKQRMHLTKKNWQQELLTETIETTLFSLEKNIYLAEASCHFSFISPLTLSKLPLNWWQNHACFNQTQAFSYAYMIEPLSQDPCLTINNQPGESALFKRLSLCIWVKTHKACIQAIYALTTINQEECKESKHRIKAGRQSLSWLN
jgi:hypothetical protein